MDVMDTHTFIYPCDIDKHMRAKSKSVVTTIAIKPSTRDKLGEYVHKHDTYDDIINKLLEIAKKHPEARNE